MTEIFAHRGASGYAPENTMDAFKLAVKQGAEGIELDIQLSKDGIPVVIHDETIDRVIKWSWICQGLYVRRVEKLYNNERKISGI